MGNNTKNACLEKYYWMVYIKGFYRGFHYALMRAIPFMTMEMCKKYC